MSATVHKVACPKCQAALKTPKPIPPGTPVQCPMCRHAFKVGRNGTGVSASATNGARVASAPAPASAESAPAGNPAARMLVVLLGFGAVTAMGIFLAYLCFAPGDAKDKPELVQGKNESQGSGGGVAVNSKDPQDGDPAKKSGQAPGAEKKAGPGPAPIVLVEPKVKPKNAPPPKPLVNLTKEQEALVHNIVKKGVDWLKHTQTPEGTWVAGGAGGFGPEYAALGGLTLLECGVPANDPAVQKAANYVRSHCLTRVGTYNTSVFILFLDKLNQKSDLDYITVMAMRLVAAQQPSGGWGYIGSNIPTPGEAEALAAYLKDLAKNPAAKPDQLPEKLRSLGVFTPLPRNPQQPVAGAAGDEDNSNTQFALLALWVARRHGLPVERSLELVAHRFRATQGADGSWVYKPSNLTVKGSERDLPTMTCSGLLGLAVGYGVTPSGGADVKNPKTDPAIQKALTHLSRSIEPVNPNLNLRAAKTEMYFLWSVGRVGTLYEMDKIGNKNWFFWGLDILRTYQYPDGHWHLELGHGSTPLVDTCFALLFLQRINLVEDLTDKLREAMRATGAVSRLDARREDGL